MWPTDRRTPTRLFAKDYASAVGRLIPRRVNDPAACCCVKMQHYRQLVMMAVIHFAAMYVLMYAMVSSIEDVIPNNNNLYMAALMTSVMLLVEVVLMRSMYPVASYNAVVIAAGVLLLIGPFAMIRKQATIDDTQFLKSMIPHHSGAILMCREATVTDPRIRDLCRRIVDSQEREIEEMETLLNSID